MNLSFLEDFAYFWIKDIFVGYMKVSFNGGWKIKDVFGNFGALLDILFMSSKMTLNEFISNV